MNDVTKIELDALAYHKEFQFSIQDEIIKQQVELEEDCLKQVLTQFLKREPTTEDAKKCEKVFKVGVYNKYIIVFLGVQLGTIERILDFYDTTYTYRIEFTPYKSIFVFIANLEK